MTLDDEPERLIEIDPDTEISLQIPGGVRTTVTLLGRVPGQYLVLRGSGLNGLRFSYGDRVILRYLHAGVICGFGTLVLKMLQATEALLVVSYPRAEMVRQHPLRSTQRLTCTLPCLLTFEGTTSTGLVLDLSETGCQCALPLDAAGVNALAEVGEAGQVVDLRLLAFDHLSEVPLAAKVRRIARTGRGMRFGLQFVNPEPARFARIADLLSLAELGAGADSGRAAGSGELKGQGK